MAKMMKSGGVNGGVPKKTPKAPASAKGSNIMEKGAKGMVSKAGKKC